MIFSLPSRGDRSPDVAWVSLERWESLTTKEREGFPLICHDFAIKLWSPNDRLKPLQEKMQEYLDSGLKLGWLINPQNKQVEIYRAHTAVEVVDMSVTLSGENTLLELKIILDY